MAAGVTLTLAAGTSVRMGGNYAVDVLGTLYAVGTAASPITFTHAVSEAAGAWGYVYLRGEPCTLDYVTWQYGGGVNDAAGSTLRHCRGLTCTYGLATLSASDVTSLHPAIQRHRPAGLRRVRAHHHGLQRAEQHA